jgi:hypothetical protein
MGMKISPLSLSKTVDSVNESTFFSRKSTPAERLDVARWIADRQNLPGCYGEMFAPFQDERKVGIQLFTGERITSASARHIIGEEACRAIRQLKARDKSVQAALDRADQGMMKCLTMSQRERGTVGWFCCGKCSVGMWRNLLAGGLDRKDERLSDGIRILKQHRADKGWRRFPLWYTVLALLEMDDLNAVAELKHVSATLERAVNRRSGTEQFASRRRAVAERALARI